MRQATVEDTRKLAIAVDTADDPYNELPFVREISEGKGRSRLCLWDVASTGKYDLDCALGSALGRSAIEFCQRYPKEAFGMTFVFQAIIKKGEVTGIEVGFISHMFSMIQKGMAAPVSVVRRVA